MKAENESIRELDGLLEQRLLSGLWRIPAGERPLDPKTDVKPHLWKWADVYDSLLKARDRIGIHAAVNERRTIRLVNPGLKETEMTSHTMLFAFQLIQPSLLPRTATRWPRSGSSSKGRVPIRRWKGRKSRWGRGI
jgi:gentisate 1,2-dioxygenase